MKKFLPLVFCALFLVVSCKKNREVVVPETSEPEKPAAVEEFVFQSINYSLKPDYKENLVFEEKRLSSLENGTSLTQYIQANTSGIYEHSLFKSDNDQTFKIKDLENLSISVPQYVVNRNIYLGDKRWKYSTMGENLPTTLNVKQDIPVKPNTTTVVTAHLTYRENTILYVATFIGEKTGKKIEVNGTWKGKSLFGVDFKDESGPLKPLK